MKELSIFIDESGDLGEVKERLLTIWLRSFSMTKIII